MRIAIDVDNCIANTQEYDLAHGWQFNRRRNPQDKTVYSGTAGHDAFGVFNFDIETGNEFYLRQRAVVIEQGLIYPRAFAAEAIGGLMEEGHEVIVLTMRSDGNWAGNATAETEKWLKQYGIPFSECVTNCKEKGEFCKNNQIDLLIEDSPSKAKQANDLGIASMLLLWEYNKNYHHKLNSFASCWPEAYEKLTGKLLKACDI